MHRVLRCHAAVILALLIALSASSCAGLAGWMAPDDRLTFPEQPIATDESGRLYDVDRNGIADFAVRRDARGRFARIEYDDDEDGAFDRSYLLADKHPGTPHLILLIDSLPWRIVHEQWCGGQWTWFHEPRKVIPPFPSLSEVIFSEMLHAPPLGGNVERHYDRRTGGIENLWVDRAFGYEHPWHRRLDSHVGSYLNVGMSYVNPRPWFHSELAAAKAALDGADDLVTVAYILSSSSMLSRYGRAGLDECLAEIDRLCLQLFWERQGSIDITIVSDHGHNLTQSPNFPVEEKLAAQGFRPVHEIADRLVDVVAEIDGLVTYFGVHTSRPVEVADAMLREPEIQLAFYLDGERVVARDRQGLAFVEHRAGRYRYRAVSGDPLRLLPTVAALRAAGQLDVDDFGQDGDWFAATVDLEYPDALHRVWHAFHGQVINPPQVLFTLHDGHCAGMPAMEDWIDMQSTHGGLNQINSDAVLLTTKCLVARSLRSRDVLLSVEPRLASRLVR